MSTSTIQQLEAEIRAKKAELLALKKAQPPEEIKDYTLQNTNGEFVRLSDMFGDADELLVIHNMGKACTYCTMWADGFRGITEVMGDRMPWVLTSPDEPAILKMFGESRSWNFKTYSHAGTDFAYDLGFENRKEGKKSFEPGVSALIKKDGKMYRVGKDGFGPGDDYNVVWHFMDLFPKGVNGWTPKYIY